MKYGNVKCVSSDGIKFDSKKELQRWLELKLLLNAGHIANLERQVKYMIIEKSDKYRASHYIADFVYQTPDGRVVIEDVKGYRGGQAYTIYKLKKKLVYNLHGIDITEI